MTRTRWRKLLSKCFVTFCALSVLIALVPLALILFFVISQGLRALNVDFFTQMPKPVGETGGGMANSIVGTLILTTPNIVGLRSRVRFFGSGFYHRDSRPLREAERNPFHHIALSTFADVRYALHTSGFRLTAVSHTHIKPVSFLYAWMAPWMWLYTSIAFRKETNAAQRRANREVRSALFSKSVLFGENLLLTAEVQGSRFKVPGSNHQR